MKRWQCVLRVHNIRFKIGLNSAKNVVAVVALIEVTAADVMEMTCALCLLFCQVTSTHFRLERVFPTKQHNGESSPRSCHVLKILSLYGTFKALESSRMISSHWQDLGVKQKKDFKTHYEAI